MTSNLNRDPRGATLRPLDICKLLLLDPKRFHPQGLQRIGNKWLI